MLVNDDSKGMSDGKERDQLQAMLQVGSEFMTYRDQESTVQRSGEFVRIDKEVGDSQPRFLLLHETSQTYLDGGGSLTGDELLNLPPNVRLHKRSRLFMSEQDTQSGDLPFREIGGFDTSSRISRHHGPGSTNTPSSRGAVAEANYTAQAGKRRFFAKGDGKVWLVREVVVPGDARYFNDSMRALESDPIPHSKKRGLRAARVEVVEINPTTGKRGKAVLSFDVHSGLSYDPNPRFFVGTGSPGGVMYDDSRNYAAYTGVNFGSSLNIPDGSSVPQGGDASDTYAVCEPAIARTADGRDYTSIVAVFPAPDDVYDARGSGPYRLTCKRTTPTGGVALGKIPFPPLPHLPQHYLAARGMSLHRLSPTTVVLRVHVHAMRFAAAGSVQAEASDAFFMWSDNNGETWTYVAPAVGYIGVGPYGGLLAKDKSTLLAFSFFAVGMATPVTVHRITASGTAQIGTVDRATFSAGLMKPGTGESLVPYIPVGFGGAVARKAPDGKKKERLWMQFDPQWGYASTDTWVLDYPGSRPMLLVSDDGGLTWQRRMLPVEWAFRAGFVVSIDEVTLAVPVYSARKEPFARIAATIYVSKDGGDTWKASGARISLTGETHVDGQITHGAQYQDSLQRWKFERDIVDCARQYNRGELYPMVVLRNGDGKLMPSNPGRPWMADYRFKEPTYG